MLRDKKCSLFAWQKKEIFQVEYPACGWDVSVLHTAVGVSLREKIPFFSAIGPSATPEVHD